MKKKLLVHHRPDGVIELRRRRLRDSAGFKDATVLVGLCVGCVAFIALLAAILVETPALLVATAALVLPVALALLLAQQPDLAPAGARPGARAVPRHAPQLPRRPPDDAA